MKEIIVSMAALAFTIGSLSAQVFLGGSFSINNTSNSATNSGTTTDEGETFSFGLAPSVGYYMNEKLAIGASISYNYANDTHYNNNSKTRDKVEDKQSMFSITPFVRYHVLELGNLSVLGQAGLGLGFRSDKTTQGSVTTDNGSSFTLGLGVSPGVSYKFTDNIAIEAFLGSLAFANTSTKEPNGNKTSSTNFGLNFSTGLGLGFIYKF